MFGCDMEEDEEIFSSFSRKEKSSLSMSTDSFFTTDTQFCLEEGDVQMGTSPGSPNDFYMPLPSFKPEGFDTHEKPYFGVPMNDENTYIVNEQSSFKAPIAPSFKRSASMMISSSSLAGHSFNASDFSTSPQESYLSRSPYRTPPKSNVPRLPLNQLSGSPVMDAPLMRTRHFSDSDVSTTFDQYRQVGRPSLNVYAPTEHEVQQFPPPPDRPAPPVPLHSAYSSVDLHQQIRAKQRQEQIEWQQQQIQMQDPRNPYDQPLAFPVPAGRRPLMRRTHSELEQVTNRA
jgi:hypothetical protein